MTKEFTMTTELTMLLSFALAESHTLASRALASVMSPEDIIDAAGYACAQVYGDTDFDTRFSTASRILEHALAHIYRG